MTNDEWTEQIRREFEEYVEVDQGKGSLEALRSMMPEALETMFKYYLARAKKYREEIDDANKIIDSLSGTNKNLSDMIHHQRQREANLALENEKLKDSISTGKIYKQACKGVAIELLEEELEKRDKLLLEAKILILEMNTAIGFVTLDKEGRQTPLSKQWLKDYEEMLK